MSGKGSKPRPLAVPYSEYCDRWDEIFKKNKPQPVVKIDNKTKKPR